MTSEELQRRTKRFAATVHRTSTIEHRPLNITRLPYQLASSIIDFIYPPVCISCQALIPDGSQRVCESCWRAVRAVTADLPLYQETKARLLEEGHIDNLVSCFLFEKEGPLQFIIHALKYQQYESLGLDLGRRIGRVISERQENIDVIIPVPLHKVKQRERGYNQAELIARGISVTIGKPLAGRVIRRTRDTLTQTKLNVAERKKNVEGAFAIVPAAHAAIKGRVCLLVDDVITTGATAGSCAKELLAAGATHIIAGSAALAV